MIQRFGRLGVMVALGALLPLVQTGIPSELGRPVGRVLAASVQHTTPAVLVNRQANTITYRTAQAMVVALASPPGSPDETWNIAGLVNPTLVIARGARVRLEFINADHDSRHGWELTTMPPPYPRTLPRRLPVAFPGAVVLPVHSATAGRWFGRVLEFTAARAGTYYYLCTVPHHAAMGMYGRLVVN